MAWYSRVVSQGERRRVRIYIGRFHRWNSWDLLTHPHRILAQAFERVVNPLSHPRTVGVTLMFGAMMLVMYLMVNAMGPRAARES